MAGADQQIRELLKEMKLCNASEREIHYARLAEQYGHGFAATVRAAFARKLATHDELRAARNKL